MSYVDSVISLIMMPIGVGRFIGRPLESGRRRGVETTIGAATHHLDLPTFHFPRITVTLSRQYINNADKRMKYNTTWDGGWWSMSRARKLRRGKRMRPS